MKKFHTFLCSHKFHKIEDYFSFEVLKKKIWANFQRIIELFTKKDLSVSSQKYGFGIRDPRSGIRDLEKTYSGSWIQGSKRQRIPDPGSGSATLPKAIRISEFYRNCPPLACSIIKQPVHGPKEAANIYKANAISHLLEEMC